MPTTKLTTNDQDELLSPDFQKKIHPDFPVTITQFLMKEYADYKYQNELNLLLTQIQIACKRISSAIRNAPLQGLFGQVGYLNAQGEEVQKLDVIANDHFIGALSACGKTTGMVSEENKSIIQVGDHCRGPFVVCFDPLDGSSNIDVAVPVGSIFAIYLKKTKDKLAKEEDFLQPGRELVCAGYSVYGSCSMLVIATKNGVNGFTQDQSGEYLLSHPNITIPKKGKIFSFNGGNYASWERYVREYVSAKQNQDPLPYSQRYVGSMVSDIHRTLLKGGIFAYPKDKKSPNGKLRLLYECNPMAFIMKKAGGKASTGEEDVLDVQPEHIHQRKPIFIGSPEDVDELLSFKKK